MTAKDLMTANVKSCRADTDLASVAKIMWDCDCGTVPVVNEERKVIGLEELLFGRRLRRFDDPACRHRCTVAAREDDDPLPDPHEECADEQPARLRGDTKRLRRPPDG